MTTFFCGLFVVIVVIVAVVIVVVQGYFPSQFTWDLVLKKFREAPVKKNTL